MPSARSIEEPLALFEAGIVVAVVAGMFFNLLPAELMLILLAIGFIPFSIGCVHSLITCYLSYRREPIRILVKIKN